MNGTASPILEQPPARWVSVAPGVEMRPMVEGAGVVFLLYRIGPGTRFSPHSHEFAELGVVVSGEGHLLYEGESRTVRGGDSFFIPSGGRHGFDVPLDGRPVVMLNATVGQAGEAADPSASAIIRLAERLVETSASSGPRRR